ncbi:MAG: hypothetical protein RL291_1989, partial [Pseudomonadota bacterium]
MRTSSAHPPTGPHVTPDELFEHLAVRDPARSPALPGVSVRGITADSRAVDAGFVFVAIKGTKADGSAFAAEAVTKGAIAILTDEASPIPGVALPIYRAREPREALAKAA